ncbi:MAG: 16S rRNA (guanine(527)-N(7))-methyltransferase RsmG [Clostridia bacterium]|nr:16S rRNA (guanine(527)-N(7))-methyltransferase RsmG [Clostridia bacterium]MBQ9856090.1 16S rRNA (guanine(527)-N(7))-methyltransferase RsmG [Clostridia bacterium]
MKNRILDSAKIMGVPLTDEQADKMVKYHEMLVSANKQMNLTRVPDDINEAADRNYLDSLNAVKHLEGVSALIDVGTGAGFPGIPIAIACPHIKVTLLDALQKRVGFLQSVIDELGLNAEAVHGRAEDAARKPEFRDAFDVATARAVAEMNVLCEWLLPFVKAEGRMLALKGPGAEEELVRAENALKQLNAEKVAVHPAPVPGRDWAHKIVEVKKTAPTPDRFPRRASAIEKKPL